VFMDLQPYVCLFSNCEVFHQVFARRRDWVIHESIAHICQKEWLCELCCKQGTHMDTLLMHLEQDHASSSGNAYRGTSKQNVKKAESIIYTGLACPFCPINLLRRGMRSFRTLAGISRRYPSPPFHIPHSWTTMKSLSLIQAMRRAVKKRP